MGLGFLPFYGFDIYQIVLLLAAVIIGGWAQGKVKNTFAYYSRVPASRGYSASEAAGMILRQNGISDVSLAEGRGGSLSDAYDPRKKVIQLSGDVYYSNSVAALAIAAHEAGHAIQHSRRYFFLSLRHFLVPVTNVASYLSFPLILLGIFASYPLLTQIGVYAFLVTVVFQLVTLPVEYDASREAMAALVETGAITQEETGGVKRMLNAAALTYVAATIVAFLTLLRLLLLTRRRN
jgi:Zn-dependent membrane protease YugP